MTRNNFRYTFLPVAKDQFPQTQQSSC